MTIDIHPHVIRTDTQRYPNAPVGGHKSDWSRERPVSVEQMISAMDQAGIAKSALIQASTCYGHDSSYIADAVAAHRIAAAQHPPGGGKDDRAGHHAAHGGEQHFLGRHQPDGLRRQQPVVDLVGAAAGQWATDAGWQPHAADG